MNTNDYFPQKVAKNYDEDVESSNAELVKPVVDFLAKLAGSGRALEFGVGTGRIAIPLEQSGVEVHGIDLSEAMLTKLTEKQIAFL